MSDPEGNSQFCFPESPDVSRDDVKGTSGLEGDKTNCFPEGPDVKCFVIFLNFQFNVLQKSRLATYKNPNLILKTTE